MLALMDNSDMELSDSDSEPDVAESDSPASSNEGDGTDSDSEDDVPLARVRAPAPKRRVMWKKTDDFTPVIVPQPDCVDLSVNHQQWSPVRYFEQYVDDNDFSAMADYTNRHFLQGTGRVLSTSTTEMKKFVGISMMMGCIGMKRIRMYWQRATRINSVADCMQRDRFSKLRNHFTVVDNNLFSDDAKAADRMWKVRPFMDRIRRTCLSLPREANVSIDEQMVSFTGRCPSRNFRVIAHFIDLALSNCWIQARQEHPTSTMQLYDFRLAIALTLMRCESTDSSSDSDPEDAPIARSRTTPLPAIGSRVSSAKHLPVACDMKNAARCRREGCKAKTRVKCEKCDMFLCVSAANNCFKAFHTR